MLLELEDVSISFNKGTVDEMKLFDGLNFSVSKGEFVSIVGSNGSGKTTLLNLICGSLRPETGRVLFNGEDITDLPEYKRARFIGRVFQDPKMGSCSDLTVLENFALADNKNKSFDLAKAINPARIDYYRELLSECNMGLEDRIYTPVGLLSGGQRQAVSLVIAGMTNVDLLILDEHTAALDPKSSERIMEITDKLVKEKNLTAVMITHNLRFAVEYGNRLIMLDKGKIIVDKDEKEKNALDVSDLLTTFNQISIECGN